MRHFLALLTLAAASFAQADGLPPNVLKALKAAQIPAANVAVVVQPVEATGITPYVAAFFAASQPNSAMDMISRIPGFSFDGGDNVRGYGGAAGNVLIDGQRPATKSESLEDALRRIQASADL